jgi:hypothetical protein
MKLETYQYLEILPYTLSVLSRSYRRDGALALICSEHESGHLGECGTG